MCEKERRPKNKGIHVLEQDIKKICRCLATAADLGVSAIHHFQGQGYYRAILAGCDVCPNQPLNFYKMAIKRQTGKDEYVNENGDEDDAVEPTSKHVICDEPSVRTQLH